MSTPGKKKTVLFVVTGNAASRDTDAADVSLTNFLPTADFFLSTKFGEDGKPLVLDTATCQTHVCFICC